MASVFRRTRSRYITDVDQGVHTFEILGYSLKSGIGVGRYIRSSSFSVGGYDWAIRVYPDGLNDEYADYVSVFLEILSKHAEVRASCELRIVKQDDDDDKPAPDADVTPLVDAVWRQPTPVFFRSGDVIGLQTPDFIRRRDLEPESSSGYTKDDRVVIECVLNVVKDSHVYRSPAEGSEITVPGSDLSTHLSKLLLNKEGSDVTFTVGGESFPAHRLVLAARSPVFKAQLYGEMMEAQAQQITVGDMQPAVFAVLLRFIYTDELASMSDLDDAEYYETIRHLLVAADRYAMDRLKLLCQSIICDDIGVDTVADTVVLADQYNCDKLRAVCVDFLEFTASSEGMDAVVATDGYASLKRSCPSVLLDVFERTNRSRKA